MGARVPTMNTAEQTTIRDLLIEAPTVYTVPESQKIQHARVDYYAITPRGTRGRFTRSVALSQIRGARSETAIYFYLKTLHPACDIQIQQMELY